MDLGGVGRGANLIKTHSEKFSKSQYKRKPFKNSVIWFYAFVL